MMVFETIFQFIGDIVDLLFDTEVFGAPLGYILAAFLVTSMAISVFWRGARG
ncbi:MAG: hypothetical protein ACLRFE_04655 [Clostridia bacterium]